jgi:undecaprenyl-diphosphatase
MTQRLLGLRIPGIAFEVAVHVATLLSVLVVYRERVTSLLRGVVGRERHAWMYTGKLAAATLPAVVVVLFFEDWIEARFDDPSFTGAMLLVTGCFLWSTRWARGAGAPRPVEYLPIAVVAAVAWAAGVIVPFLGVLALVAAIMGTARRTARREWEAEPGWGTAGFMGVAQALAIFPGISRSGSTVVTGIWKRAEPVAAAEFSFLMSVIAITGAAVLKTPEVMEQGVGVAPLPLAVGFVAAAVSGVAAIRFFVLLLKRQNFYSFSWYCWAAGALFLFYVRGGG